MKENNFNTYNNLEEDSIDIIAIIKNVWIERKLIFKISFIFLLIGLLIAISTPSVYTSQTTFVPQLNQDELSNSRGLGSLASIVGIDLNSTSSNDSYLSPLLYTKISETDEFLLKLLYEEIYFEDGNKISVKSYLKDNYSTYNILSIIITIKDYFIKKNTVSYNDEIKNNFNYISDEDYDLNKLLKEKFLVTINDTEGYLNISSTTYHAIISAQIVKHITQNLQEKIIKLRTKKVREQLEFSKKQYELKQEEFDLLQKQLAEFKDSNKNISTAMFLSQLQSLESEYQLQQNILVSLASEYNSNKIKLNKNTPIFSVIDEVSIANEKSGPKRLLILLLSVFIGLIVSIGLVIGKETINDLKDQLK
jgi:uncharacterized protein involved in exopolysaccharide biosynthesis